MTTPICLAEVAPVSASGRVDGLRDLDFGASAACSPGQHALGFFFGPPARDARFADISAASVALDQLPQIDWLAASSERLHGIDLMFWQRSLDHANRIQPRLVFSLHGRNHVSLHPFSNT